jgi:hypothetical protein
MKWVRYLLLVMLIGLGTAATAQQRSINNNVQQLRQRMNELQLTMEQKRRLALLIRRERMQFYMNQKDLNDILTEKQKEMLIKWRNNRLVNKSDSVVVK